MCHSLKSVLTKKQLVEVANHRFSKRLLKCEKIVMFRALSFWSCPCVRTEILSVAYAPSRMTQGRDRISRGTICAKSCQISTNHARHPRGSCAQDSSLRSRMTTKVVGRNDWRISEQNDGRACMATCAKLIKKLFGSFSRKRTFILT